MCLSYSLFSGPEKDHFAPLHMLNLKYFSNSNTFFNSITENKSNKLDDDITQTKFVQISVDKNSMMVANKSSLCWLFDNHKTKISNDRLCHFKNNKNVIKNRIGNKITNKICVPKKQKIVHWQIYSCKDSNDDSVLYEDTNTCKKYRYYDNNKK